MLKRFTVWIEDKTLKDLKQIGKVKDREISWLIRKACAEFIERNKETVKESSPS